MPSPTDSPSQLSVRVPSELLARLRAVAAAERNSVGAVTRRLLTKSLRAEDDRDAEAKRRG